LVAGSYRKGLILKTLAVQANYMQSVLDAVTPWTPILFGILMLLSVLFLRYPPIKWKRVLWAILGAYLLYGGIHALWKS
jgi:hypothetical protein